MAVETVEVTRICFFSGDISRSGGTERVAVAIANELSQDPRYEVFIISLFETAQTPYYAVSPEVARHSLYPGEVHGVWRLPWTCRRLAKLVKSLRIDCLIDVDGILDMYSLPVKALTGVRVMSWEHFNFHQNPDVPYRRLTRRLAARFADAIVTLTAADKRMYEENLGLRCPIEVIPNPVEAPEPEAAYDSSSTMILSSGRLTYQKGFDMLVDVASRVLLDHPGWTWVVLGEGEDRDALESLVAKHHLEGRVRFIGRVADVESYYRKAAMFVLTSRFEGLPMVLLEAKAHKLPIVSFDCETGPAEIVADGVNGFLVPCFDVEIMSGRIRGLMDDIFKRILLSNSAHKDIEKYAACEVGKGWTDLLNSIIFQ